MRLQLLLATTLATTGVVLAATAAGCADNLECTDNCGSTSNTDASSGDVVIPTRDGGDAAGDSSGDVGVGEAGCSAPTTLMCGTSCVDPTKPSNCGSCGHACEAGAGGTATCTAGVCGTGCMGSTPDNCNGACTSTATDPNNCGTCGTLCPAPKTSGTGHAECSASGDGGPACSLACTAPTSQSCSGDCVDPTSPLHCGSSCVACPGPTTGAATGGAVCTVEADGGGACSVLCSTADSQQCPGTGGQVACYAPNDLGNCGKCGNACKPPPSTQGQAVCQGSPLNCDVSCNPSFHPCSGDCLSNADPPSVTTDPCIISETFGIFVSPGGADGNAGTQMSPVKTLGHAMDLAKTAGKRVYACATATGSYQEPGGGGLVVGNSRDGVHVYGALDCTTAPAQWKYSAGTKATVVPTIAGYALQVSGLTTGVTFEDFAFTSLPGVNPGDSSIAVFAASSSGVVLTRCSVTAGAGVGGSSASPAAQASPAPGGNPGGASRAATGTGAGGPQQPNPSCPTSIGGAGGSAAVGGNADGQSGQVGTDNHGSSAGCNSLPQQGGGGGVSATTSGSAGPAASDWATFTTSGWSPLGGGAGGPGSAGQGGGGGGVATPGAVAAGGAGSGGAGGCGGAGGAPGTGGGSSIAMLLFDTSATLNACTLTTANAGAGGHGAAGQPGQAGGGAGAGYTITGAGDACNGGQGGAGSAGGPGGGGAGGVSAGVVWTGTTPTVTGGAQTPGAAGAAGGNGDGTTTAKAGTAGGVVQFQ